MSRYGGVTPTGAERLQPRAGDHLVPHAAVIMDRAFTVPGDPPTVWPWIVQLGKQRAGWYLPHTVERFLPRSRRAVRRIDPRWQSLAVGTVIPDYGGRHETFTVAVIEPPTTLVYTSRRGSADVSWSITLRAEPDSSRATRVLLRLRVGPVRHRRLVETAGGLVDLLTIAGLARGLHQRLRDQLRPS